MPEPSVNVLMPADTPFRITRNEKITIAVETTATIQFRRSIAGPWVTLTPSNLTAPAASPEGAHAFSGLEGQIQVTTVTGEVSFTRWQTSQS